MEQAESTTEKNRQDYQLIYVVFILTAFLLIYTYLVYPYFLKRKAGGKTLRLETFTREDDLPEVHILIPVQNEEKVIGDKLNSILLSAYPKEKIYIHIGLDNCTDSTKNVIESGFSEAVHLVEFSERQGKPSVLNQMVAGQNFKDNALLLLTDASVLFSENTIFELVKYFKDEQVGLVDANIQPKRVTNENENLYWEYENRIKEDETLVYHCITGPSGGCYAIRKSLFTSVPANFLVDDFYIGFSIAVRQYHTLFNKEAVCYEDIITGWKQEFTRKIRIATGNFQNLWRFKKQALNPFGMPGFVFLSHKVLRWKTPFLLLILYYILLLEWTLPVLLLTITLPLLDLLLGVLGAQLKPLRRFHYFLLMNAAVFIGFVRFCIGVKSNIWQPTVRN